MFMEARCSHDVPHGLPSVAEPLATRAGSAGELLKGPDLG